MNRMSHLIALLLLPAWILSACKPSNPSPNAEGQTILTPISPLVTPAGTLPGSVEELADGGARVITGDGLSLTLDASGQVTALSLNGEALPVNTAQPLLLRDLTEAAAANAPNLLANPGFEEEESGWGRYLTKGDISIQAASDDPREGEHALALRSEGGGAGAVISEAIPVLPGRRYRVSGSFRADLGYVAFAGPPTIWQDRLYSGGSTPTGLYLQWLGPDGQPLEASPALAAALHWNAQGWHPITREVTAPSGAVAVRVIAGAQPVSGTVWIDDLAFIESPEADIPFKGALTVYNDRIVQSGETLGLQVSITYRPYGDHLAITTTVTDPSGGPRALDAAWGLPMDAAGWTWWDGMRESRPVKVEGDYARAVSADITGYLPISLYPYAMLENGRQGLSLALSLDSPRYVLLHYDGPSGRYEGRAHLGISPLASRLNGSADFTLLLYQSNAAWGLRAAAAEHAAIGPDWYATPGNQEQYADFAQDHFSPSGKGGQRLKAYNEAHVYAAQYTVFELNAKIAGKDDPRPTYAEALNFMEGNADAANLQQATFAASVACDAAGEAHLKGINVYPWANENWSAIWVANVDPDLPGGYGGAMLAYLKDLFANTAEAGLTINGVEIDNFISVSMVDLCPAHIATADLPLTYDPNTYKPGVHVASAAWEYLTQLRGLLDSQPEPYRGISVNFWGLGIPNLLSPYLDGFAGEGKVASAGATNWEPAILDYRRAAAMTRLRMFSIQEPNLTRTQFEKAAHEAIFYATLVGRGPHAANWPDDLEAIMDWANDQSRPLAALGWQPIPYASTDQPDVWVERYGSQAFAVHNWGPSQAEFTLTIDLPALGLQASELRPSDSISGQAAPFTLAAGSMLQISGRLEAGRTAVYWLTE